MQKVFPAPLSKTFKKERGWAFTPGAAMSRPPGLPLPPRCVGEVGLAPAQHMHTTKNSPFFRFLKVLRKLFSKKFPERVWAAPKAFGGLGQRIRYGHKSSRCKRLPAEGVSDYFGGLYRRNKSILKAFCAGRVRRNSAMLTAASSATYTGSGGPKKCAVAGSPSTDR